MKGYKVFNKDWTCKGFHYEVGKTYEMEEDPVCCKSGFHFCRKLINCFNYYEFDSKNKVAEIEAMGAIGGDENKEKYCTNKIKIVRELSWHEVLDLVNVGKDNTGNRNSGDRNSGNRNSGNRNSGNWNSGDLNSGDLNSGDRNSGDWNSGNLNSGDWNSTNFSTGCFNTKEEKIRLFNKRSKWTYRDWRCSSARDLMCDCPYTKKVWINEKYMTDSEKEENPIWESTGGYLKTIEATNKDKQDWWDNLDDEEQEEIKRLPNFDKEIFKEITGIEVAE